MSLTLLPRDVSLTLRLIGLATLSNIIIAMYRYMYELFIELVLIIY